MTCSGLVEIRHSAISTVHLFHPLRGTGSPLIWSAGPGRRGKDDRGDVAGAVHFEVKLFHVGFG
jgi:hypothetical protein